jgi:hypothetical protein
MLNPQCSASFGTAAVPRPPSPTYQGLTNSKRNRIVTMEPEEGHHQRNHGFVRLSD